MFTAIKKRLTRRVVTGTTVALALTLSATAAFAEGFQPTGTSSNRHYYATNNVAFSLLAATPAGTWVNVPGMARTVTIPAGTRQLINARFTAESQCAGGAYCSVRIVYVRPTGAVIEMDPQVGTDFAFRSPGGNAWESNAIERTTRRSLPAGVYSVRVQAAKVGAVTTHRLDDMHLTVQTVNPAPGS